MSSCRTRYRLCNSRHAVEGLGSLSVDRRDLGARVCGLEMSRGGYRSGRLGCGDRNMGRVGGGLGFDDRGIRDHGFWEMYRYDGCCGTTVVHTRPRTDTPLRCLGETFLFGNCRIEEARNGSHIYHDDRSLWRMRSVRGRGANEGRDNRHTHHHHSARLRKSVFRGRGKEGADRSPNPNPRQSLRLCSRPSSRRTLEEGRPHWTDWEAELFNGKG